MPSITTEKVRFYSDDRTANTLVWDSTNYVMPVEILTIESVTFSFTGQITINSQSAIKKLVISNVIMNIQGN